MTEPRTTAVAWPNLVAAVRDRTHRAGSEAAYAFLNTDQTLETLTMDELDARARGLAATMQRAGLADQPVVLLFPAGIDFIVGFWACLYARAIAVPTYPPDPRQLERTMPRLTGILRDSGARAVLTTPAIAELTGPIVRDTLGRQDLEWLHPGMAGAAEEWTPPEIGSDHLAFLQYTSGSTGDPKGVMVGHGNLLANAHMIARAMDLRQGSTAVIWLPPYHDMGLIGGIVQPIVSGVSVVLMSPVDFISRPLRWLSLISRQKLQTSGGPNFAYELCARRITARDKAGLDLSSWTMAFSGAEPIRSGSLRRFSEAFAACGFKPEAFFPCYGLAEATLFVTGGAVNRPPTVRTFDRVRLGAGEVADARSLASTELVGVGRPGLGVRVRIVDPETCKACPPDRIGEIWVQGPNVAQGYWRREEDTARTFHAHLAGEDDGPRYLRTGDLGFIADDELFVVGRIKDLLIVNGTNYYPADIEAVADRAHPSIREGSTAAVGLDRPGGEVLAIVAEAKTDRREDLEEAAAAIRTEVTRSTGISPEVIAFIARRTLPKTSSGKVRRSTVRQGLLDGSLVTHAVFDTEDEAEYRTPPDDEPPAVARLPAAEREQALTAMAFEALRAVKKSAAETAGLDTPVTELGLDSLDVVELLAEMEERSGAVLPMERLARGGTIRELVKAAAEALDNAPLRPGGRE